LLYKIDKLSVPKGERLQLIREAHASKVAGNFGVGKKISNLQRYMYWLRMKEDVAWYIRGCILYCTKNPSNIKQGLYHPLLIPIRTWENISMNFVGGLPTTRKGHVYIFVVVDRFINLCILMPCKNTIKG
jgi:hypothetical protein